MALGAFVVKEMVTSGLHGIESEFGVRAEPLGGVTANKRRYKAGGKTEQQGGFRHRHRRRITDAQLRAALYYGAWDVGWEQQRWMCSERAS